MSKRTGNSIGKKLTVIFLLVFTVVFIVNAFIYINLNQTIKQIDNVYESNVELNDLSENLKNIQEQLYQYLSTKSSESLESYYMYEQDYRSLLSGLNQEITGDANRLAEKNIYNMSWTYLTQTDLSIEAKRGRDVTKYNEAYKESQRIYDYIQTTINSMNTSVFLSNAYNYSALRSILSYIMVISITALGIVLAIGLGLLISMTKSITKPLVELANAANEIARGNMEVDFPIVETGDEITSVAKACNKMITSIRSYIDVTKENYERESLLKENELLMKNDLKEAQLKYLQAQINPHFLFNSLNAGAQLAMMEGAERATLFIENLADFFRYNVRKMEADTTLGEELRLIDNYIYILNVRFSGEIHYETTVDDRCLDKKMPSMVLQPIVENAVNHGIKNMEGLGCIQLRVFYEDGRICVRVSDNGKGIDSSMVNRIMQGKSQQSDSRTGIGLDNVISRLKSYYNTERVFEIAAREKGTEVTLYLP